MSTRPVRSQDGCSSCSSCTLPAQHSHSEIPAVQRAHSELSGTCSDQQAGTSCWMHVETASVSAKQRNTRGLISSLQDVPHSQEICPCVLHPLLPVCSIPCPERELFWVTFPQLGQGAEAWTILTACWAQGAQVMSLTPQHCWRSGCFLRSRGPLGCCTEQWSPWGQKPWQQWRGPRSGCVHFLCALFPACKGAEAQVRGAQACRGMWWAAQSKQLLQGSRWYMVSPRSSLPQRWWVPSTCWQNPSPSWMANMASSGWHSGGVHRWCGRNARSQTQPQYELSCCTPGSSARLWWGTGPTFSCKTTDFKYFLQILKVGLTSVESEDDGQKKKHSSTAAGRLTCLETRARQKEGIWHNYRCTRLHQLLQQRLGSQLNFMNSLGLWTEKTLPQ